MDPETFRARSPAELPPTPRPTKKQSAAGRPFIRGPIPVDWVARAHSAGGSAATVGMALFFLRGVSRSPGAARVDRSIRRRFGLSADQTTYGLRALEAAGLVRFIRQGRGRCPVVEIVAGDRGGER